MGKFTIIQNDVTYILSDEDLAESSLRDVESYEYVFLVDGVIKTYMDCIVEDKLDDMVRTRLLWYHPKELPNELPKLVQTFKKKKYESNVRI